MLRNERDVIFSAETPAATLADTSVSIQDFLSHLHRRSHLVPALHEAVIERWLVRQAEQAELRVNIDELQRGVDAFRATNRLHSAAATHAWLKARGLSLESFERNVEFSLLIEKFKDHVTRTRIARRFDADRPGYTWFKLRLLVVPRDDLARELLHQIRDDGRDFGELARAHSLYPAPAGWVLQRHLPSTIAEALNGKTRGQVVGPLAVRKGFALALVESIQGPELDATTTAVIRQALFDEWLAEQLLATPISMPVLDALA